MTEFYVCCVYAVVIFCIAGIGAYMPMHLKTQGGKVSLATQENYQIAFQLGNIFSGGVMLSAGLVHLLGDAVDCNNNPFPLQGVLSGFPLAFFLGAVGFLLALTLDKMADIYLTNIATKKQQQEPLLTHDEESQGLRKYSSHFPTQEVSFFSGVVLAIALSVHSFLAGVALSVENNANQIFDIFIAIIAHKGMAAYALGAALLESQPSNQQFWTVIGCFSMSTPIGIFVGYGINNDFNYTVADALKALAAGTFLYVAIMEVIPKELQDTKLRAWKLVFLWLGFLLMSLLAIWT